MEPDMEEHIDQPTISTADLLIKITNILQYLLIATALILPAFFIPLTSDWFEINKQVLVIGVTLIGYVLWASKMVLRGEVRLIRTRMGLPAALLGIAVLVSAIAAPSRLVSFTNMNTWSLFALPFLYFLYLNNLPTKKSVILTLGSLLTVSTALSLLALYKQGIDIGLWIQPTGIPTIDFTPAGSVINLNALQIFTAAVAGVIALRTYRKSLKVGLLAIGLVSIVALLLNNPFSSVNKPLLLGVTESWSIAFETVKHSPIVGAGPGKYVESFMRFKPLSFNKTETWGISFGSASSAPLQIMTETGLLGFATFAALLFMAFLSLKETFLSTLKNLAARTSEPTATEPHETGEGHEGSDQGEKSKEEKKPKRSLDLILQDALGTGLLALLILLIFFPLTTTILFLFFVVAALFEKQRFLLRGDPGQEVQIWVLTLPVDDKKEGEHQEHQPAQLDKISKAGLAKLLLALLIFLNVLGFYGLGRAYAAEIKFNNSLKMAQEQNGTETYRLQQEAIKLNPFEARFHVSYANTNMGIANALAGKNDGQVSDEDNRNIGILINQAVREARRAVTLAQNNSAYWENMGNIYRDLRGAANGAETWALSSYSQAITLSPSNPRLRVSLGGIYYGLGDYDKALTAFQDAVRLKDDYANAYYNLAWTYRQQERFAQAIQAMEQAIQKSQSDSPDLAKAKGELEDFKRLAGAQQRLAGEQQQNGVLGEQAEATPSAEPEVSEPQEESSPSAEVTVGEEEVVNEELPPSDESGTDSQTDQTDETPEENSESLP